MKVAVLFVATACLACQSSDTLKDSCLNEPRATDRSDDVAATSDDGPTSGPAADGSASDGNVISEDFVAALTDFDCNRNSEWTMVEIAHYKNALGHDAEMLATAESATGGTYPVGTIVQLNPLEAMVKRGQGFDATSNDWEFFLFNGPPDGGTGVSIANRGGGTTVSNARGTCLSCHHACADTLQSHLRRPRRRWTNDGARMHALGRRPSGPDRAAESQIRVTRRAGHAGREVAGLIPGGIA